MRSRVLFVLSCLTLAAHPSAAAVITLQQPDVMLGTCELQQAPPPQGIFKGRLRVYEEGGVRLDVFTHYPGGAKLTVDCNHLVEGLGTVIDTDGVPLFSMFAQDGDRITVTSLTGDAIRRIRISVGDYFGGPGTCDLLVFSLGFSICDFSGDLNFADYGFSNGVTAFSMHFATDNFDGVATVNQLEVPEPISVAMIAVGLTAVARRRGQRRL